MAAANSVFGRWDDTRGDENIDFMPTILSRFDAIFIVKDVHDVERDTVCIFKFILAIFLLLAKLVLLNFCYLIYQQPI